MWRYNVINLSLMPVSILKMKNQAYFELKNI